MRARCVSVVAALLLTLTSVMLPGSAASARAVTANHDTAAAPHRNSPRANRHPRVAPKLVRRTALRSHAVLVLAPATGEVMYAKNADKVMPIASLTKLMTALVVLDDAQNMRDTLVVADTDVDRLKFSRSRLRVGTRLARADMLHIALMSSENRAASALGRNYPGGSAGFVAAMNAKARALGMHRTRFVEPTGLSRENVSTPEDLAKLVLAAQRQPLIRAYSTDTEHTIKQGKRQTVYRNTNRLIASGRWQIRLQKTGYTAEAGRCMVLHASVRGQPVVMVFLDAQGKHARARDANRIHAWLTGGRRARQP